ncbi:hypothetical protein [Selenomonas ruminantium]|uniref:Uncharacterized protein n=1 Tax=Selenomonas ruminantium TaxID=971 RepID=A0A1I0YCU7_SELRU|nr:hypothetical protein [Selenomonas ruminantium]SFB10013.1 hypothetical protein SAMN05216587_11121 [Selenomonas ruminantium]
MSFAYMFGYGVCLAAGLFVGSYLMVGLQEAGKRIVGRWIHFGD